MESVIDKLTGLQNQNQWVQARTRVDADESQWVLRLDIDRFKEINDTQGHASGDEHLALIGEVIGTACFGVGISHRMRFRSGGDEFTVVGALVDITLVANFILHRINDVVDECNNPGGISFGIGRTDQEADQAMYRNKELRKLRTTLVAPAPRMLITSGVEPLTQQAVERDQLTARRTEKCSNPGCDIKLPNHSHYTRRA